MSWLSFARFMPRFFGGSGYDFRQHIGELAKATDIQLVSVRKRCAVFTFYRKFTDENFEDWSVAFDAEGKTLTFAAIHWRGQIKLRVFSDITFQWHELPSEPERETLKRRLSASDLKLDVWDMGGHFRFCISFRLARSELVPPVFEALLVRMAHDALLLEAGLMLYCCERQDKERAS